MLLRQVVVVIEVSISMITMIGFLLVVIVMPVEAAGIILTSRITEIPLLMGLGQLQYPAIPLLLGVS